jgi:hypothetical protein
VVQGAEHRFRDDLVAVVGPNSIRSILIDSRRHRCDGQPEVVEYLPRALREGPTPYKKRVEDQHRHDKYAEDKMKLSEL